MCVHDNERTDGRTTYHQAGTLTAVARDASGADVATASRHTNVLATSSLSLTLDAPNRATGTGSALLLDGQDAALLRACLPACLPVFCVYRYVSIRPV